MTRRQKFLLSEKRWKQPEASRLKASVFHWFVPGCVSTYRSTRFDRVNQLLAAVIRLPSSLRSRVSLYPARVNTRASKQKSKHVLFKKVHLASSDDLFRFPSGLSTPLLFPPSATFLIFLLFSF